MKIKVIQKLPNEEAKVVEMDNTLGELQSFVKGNIDYLEMPRQHNSDLIFNDNFLYEDMEPNIVMPEREEIICGPLIVAGYEPETGNTISLTNNQIVSAMKYIERNKVYNMSIIGAFRYAKVLKGYQEAEDQIRKEKQMEVY